MNPLTPDDLLMRHNPVDDDRWVEQNAGGGPAATNSPVPLERFQTLEHTIRDNPITPGPYLELAKIYLGGGRWVDAKRVLDLAIKRFDDHEEVVFLHEEAQIARSLQLMSQARREHQDLPTDSTQERLDRCHVDLNVLREKICRSRLARDPSQLELHMPLATALENLGNRDTAIESLERIVQIPKLRAAASFQLGQTFQRAGNVPQALSAFRRAALYRVPPPTPELKLKALTAAAELAERTGMVDSARRYVEMLVELSPENAALKSRLVELEKREL